MSDTVALVLAAGKSTRMKSDLPKVLHPISGRPMIEFVLDAAREAGATRIIVVTGHQSERVRSALEHHEDIDFALQSEQKGTGHAVMMCDPFLESHKGPVLVLAGDTPLLRGTSLSQLISSLEQQQAACIIGSAETPDNFGLGRILRNSEGEFLRIVEQKDASEKEAAITEINTGCYAFDGESLRAGLQEIRPNNSQSEYYLTDCPEVLLKSGQRVNASPVFDINEAKGVNNRSQLAEIESVLQRRHAAELMESGVTITAPSTTYIDLRASIAAETIVHPFTVIRGAARIGQRCELGPHAVITGPVQLPDDTVTGPFTHVNHADEP